MCHLCSERWQVTFAFWPCHGCTIEPSSYVGLHLITNDSDSTNCCQGFPFSMDTYSALEW